MNHLPGGKDLPDLSVSLFSRSDVRRRRLRPRLRGLDEPGARADARVARRFFVGRLASTYFWVDPREELIVIFMTQLMPSATYPIRRELRTLVYSAFT